MNLKIQKTKNELSKDEQEQIYRNGDHTEGYLWGGGGGNIGEEGTGNKYKW